MGKNSTKGERSKHSCYDMQVMIETKSTHGKGNPTLSWLYARPASTVMTQFTDRQAVQCHHLGIQHSEYYDALWNPNSSMKKIVENLQQGKCDLSYWETLFEIHALMWKMYRLNRGSKYFYFFQGLFLQKRKSKSPTTRYILTLGVNMIFKWISS